MTLRRARAALLAAGVAVVALAPAAGAASRSLTVEGWHPRVMAFSGDRLLWTEAATVRVDPRRIAGSPAGAARFDYYRAEVFRAPLGRSSDRFLAPADTPVAMRTSIAGFTPGTLAPGGGGDFVAAPGSRRFAPPVSFCCDDDDLEGVLESDGRAGAPVTVAVTWGAGIVRMVQIAADGTQVRRTIDLATGAASTTPTALPGRAGLVAVTPRRVAWVDPARPAVLSVETAGGSPAELPLPGPAARLWAGGEVIAVAVREGAGVRVLRLQGAGLRSLWSGRRVPALAVGGGSVAIADGRRVVVARGARTARVVRSSRRVIDAVGVDGRRVAWIERATRRGTRIGVVRLGTAP